MNYDMKNPIKSFWSWLRHADKSEKIAVTCVAAFVLLFLFIAADPIFDTGLRLKLGDSTEGQVLDIIGGTGIVAVLSYLASLCGNALAPRFLWKKERKLVSTNILTNYGISTASKLLRFAKNHDLKIYRTKTEVAHTGSPKVECKPEPLIRMWSYPTVLAEYYYARNLLYFEKSEINAIIRKYAADLLSHRPELVRSQISIFMTKKSDGLQKELEECRESHSKSNLSEDHTNRPRSFGFS